MPVVLNSSGYILGGDSRIAPSILLCLAAHLHELRSRLRDVEAPIEDRHAPGKIGAAVSGPVLPGLGGAFAGSGHNAAFKLSWRGAQVRFRLNYTKLGDGRRNRGGFFWE
jgi:hypothetical protein